MQRPPAPWEKLKPGAVVLLASAAACLPLLSLPFVFYDVMSVQNNPLLRDLSNAAYTPVFRNEGFEPFTFLALMLAGKPVAWQARGFHAFSLLTHAAAWTVYRLALLLFGKEKPALLAAGGSVPALFLALSAQQQLLWRSDEAVWLRAVRLNPASPWANYMLGSYYLQRGLPGEALPRLEHLRRGSGRAREKDGSSEGFFEGRRSRDHGRGSAREPGRVISGA